MMNTPGDEIAVRVDHLRVVRGRSVVLPDLSVAVPRGSVTGLLGPSGCGKTTLLRAVVGVQVVAGGSVTVLGQPAGAPGLRRRVGYMTQAPSVYEDLSVAENLRFFAAVLRAPRRRVAEVLDLVGLAAQTSQRVGTLSGGQRARVSLATALLGEPDVLVLDEPTVGLDPLLREDLWRLFTALADAGATLLVSSHVMDEAARCDRLLLLREGRLLGDGSPREVRDRAGEDDLDRAFLALVRREEQASGVAA